MATKFITLSMILGVEDPDRDRDAEGLPFLSWRVGHSIRHRNNHARVATISAIEGSVDRDTPMAYGSTVILRFPDGSTDSFRGATLQTRWEFVETGEDDGAADEGRPLGPRLITKPITINVDSIRNFYPRKDDEPGTRVMLKTGTAYVVAEPHEEVLALIEGRQATRVAGLTENRNGQ